MAEGADVAEGAGGGGGGGRGRDDGSGRRETAKHDGLVTDSEMANIHMIDRACAVLFPIMYAWVCFAVLGA